MLSLSEPKATGADTRVVVTGVGVVCAIAGDFDEFVQALEEGRDGLQPVERVRAPWPGCERAGEIKSFSLPDDVGAGSAANLSRPEQLALCAASEAMRRAGLEIAEIGADRVGVSLGTCQGSVEELVGAIVRGDRLVEPLPLADSIGNVLGVGGPRSTPSNACAAGGAAVAMASEQIAMGHADVVLAGGADELAPFGLAGFAAMQSLDPDGCSPYSRSRGLSLGEGAGVLVLERRSLAIARGAPIVAEVLGCGVSGDAHHATAPDPMGRGAALAMRRALRQAGLGPDEIDYVNGHGTGTPLNDATERQAFRVVFGSRATKVPVSSTKSMIGHTLGAAGAIEAIACIAAIERGVIPPTIRFDEDRTDPDDFDFVPNRSRRGTVRVAMSNNYAFGGSNVSIVLGHPTGTRGPDTRGDEHPRRAVVTGIGVVGPLGVGIDAWRDALGEGRVGIAPMPTADGEGAERFLTAEAPTIASQGFAPSIAWRKMDDFIRRCVASATLAWRDGCLELSPQAMEDVAVIFGSQAGSLSSILEFAGHAERGGLSARLFPHTAVNATAGHVASVLGVRGPNFSITAGAASWALAVDHAAGLIGRGEIDVALVVAGDEVPHQLLRRTDRVAAAPGATLHEAGVLTTRAVRPFDEDADGTALGSAGVTLVLESEEHARGRGARIYAELSAVALTGATGATSGSPSDWARVMELALDRGGLAPADVDYCVAAASGIRSLDRAELEAIASILGPGPLVAAPKSLTGECNGSAAGLGFLAACVAIHYGTLAHTANLRRPHGLDVRHLTEPGKAADIGAAVVNAASGSGTFATLVARRHEPGSTQ